MSIQNLLDCFKNHDDLSKLFFYSEINGEFPPDELCAVFPGLSCKQVDQYGGEDMGREYYTVYKFTQNDNVMWIKFDGWYASYDGSNFESVFEVHPTPVTVIKYIP